MLSEEEILNLWCSKDNELKTFISNIDINNLNQFEREEMIKLSSQIHVLTQVLSNKE